MQPLNQSISKDSAQYIRKMFEDLLTKTTDLATNNTISKGYLALPDTSIYPTVKDNYENYQKILQSLTSYQTKNKGSNINKATFSNLVNKKQKLPIRNLLINSFKLDKQSADFLTDQLVLGVDCKNAIKDLGAQVLKMDNPFANQCKTFVDKVKLLSKPKEGFLRQSQIVDFFFKMRQKQYDMAKYYIEKGVPDNKQRSQVMKYVDQQKSIIENIGKLEKNLNQTYLKYRSNDKSVTKYENVASAINQLAKEVENRSKMMADFIEGLEKVEFISIKIKQASTLSIRLKEMGKAVNEVHSHIKKIQKVKESYQEIMRLEQSHSNLMKNIKTNNRKRTLVLQHGFQHKLIQLEEMVKKHFNDAYQTSKNIIYSNNLADCTYNGKVNQGQLIKNYQNRIKFLDQQLNNKKIELEEISKKYKQIKYQLPNDQQNYCEPKNLVNQDPLQLQINALKAQKSQIKTQIYEKQNMLKKLSEQYASKQKQLNNKITQLQAKLEKINSDRMHFEQKNREAQNAKRYMEQQNKQLKDQIDHLQLQYDHLKQQKDALRKQKENFVQLIRIKQSKIYKLQKQLQSSTSSPKQEKVENSLFNTFRQSSSRQTQQKFVQELGKLDCCLKIQNIMTESLKKKEQQIKESQFKCNQLSLKLQEIEKQLKQRQSQLLQASQTIKRKQRLQQFLKANQNQKILEINRINNQLKFKEEEVNIVIFQKQKLESEKINLEKQLGESKKNSEDNRQQQNQREQDKNNKLNQQIANMAIEKQRILKQLEEIKRIKTSLQASNKILSQEMHSSQNQKIQSLNQIIEQQTQKLTFNQNKMDQVRLQAINIKVDLQSKLKQKQEHIKSLKVKIDQLSVQIQDNKSTILYKDNQIQNFKKQLENEQIQRNNIREQLTIKDKQLTKLQQGIKQKEQKDKKMLKQLESEKMKVKKLQKQKVDLKEQNQIIGKNNECLQTQKNYLIDEKKRLLTQCQELKINDQELQINLRTLQIEKSKLQIQNKKNIKYTENLQKQSKNLRNKNDQLQLALKQLQNAKITLQQQIKGTSSLTKMDKLPKDIQFYYQWAADRLQINLVDVIIADKLLQGELMRKEIEHKYFILNELQRFEGKQIKQTKLIYKFDRNLYKLQCQQKHRAKINFHDYIDGKRHMLVVIKSIKGAFLAGYNSGEYTNKSPITGKGLIISLLNHQVFELRGTQANRNVIPRAMTYDDYNIIFGNSELRILCTNPDRQELFSNFGVSNGYYNNRGLNVNALLGEGNPRQTSFEDFQIYEVGFEQNEQKISNVSRSSIR